MLEYVMKRSDKMNFEIENLSCKTLNDKKILDNLNLKIKPGEIHVIMGPNGAGKSTLSKVILNCKDYIKTNGDIKIDNESIINLDTSEIANKGIFVSMQSPLSIEGVTNSEFLRCALQSKTKKNIPIYEFIKNMEKAMDDLHMPSEMMHRSINQDFSGGERKKNEILQMKILEPKLIILDELDSGLDVDSLKITCENINTYLKEHKEASVLIITHYTKILDYIKPNYVHILNKGTIVKTGDFKLAKLIEEKGFSVIDGEDSNE